MSGRIVVLINGTRKRTYPVPNGVALQDAYTLNGERWVVVAVLESEDIALSEVPNPTFTGVPE
jgi:hypothetical protein